MIKKIFDKKSLYYAKGLGLFTFEGITYARWYDEHNRWIEDPKGTALVKLYSFRAKKYLNFTEEKLMELLNNEYEDSLRSDKFRRDCSDWSETLRQVDVSTIGRIEAG